MKEIYFAGGCFWGTEHFMKQIAGVSITEVGYANSHLDHPSYEQVRTGTTGAVETVRVVYNEDQVNLPFLIRLYFQMIDPTSLNRQGEDEGTQYRTGIYCNTPEDLQTVETTLASLAPDYDLPLQVEALLLTNFYPAEEYHQDYLDKHPDGYCHVSPALFEMARKAKK